MMILAPGASYLAKYDVWCHKKDQIMMIIAPGASYGQAYSGSYDAGTASNYAVSKRSARSLPQVSSSLSSLYSLSSSSSSSSLSN